MKKKRKIDGRKQKRKVRYLNSDNKEEKEKEKKEKNEYKTKPGDIQPEKKIANQKNKGEYKL